MTVSVSSPESAVIPELGPSLGRLTDPPAAPGEAGRGALGITLDDLRLDLVTRIFELAGAARHFVAAGDRPGALHSLGRPAWLSAWEAAVNAAAVRITEATNAGLRDAAAESRFPAKRFKELPLVADDTAAIAARLGGGATAFITALETLDPAIAAASVPGERGQAAWPLWQDAVGGVARRLESAWRSLEATATAEQARWQREIARVRAWRRPVWPLGLVATVLLAAATYFGLVFGGYIDVPAFLAGVAERVWSLGWM